MEQQNPDCLSAYSWSQFAFDRFLGQQPHRPTGAAFRRRTTHHRNDALFLAVVEDFLSSRSGLVIQRSLEAAFLVAMADLSDCLLGEGNRTRDPRRADSLGQLEEHCRAKYDSNRLFATLQHLPQLLLVLVVNFESQGWGCHDSSMSQNIYRYKCSMRIPSSGRGTRRVLHASQ